MRLAFFVPPPHHRIGGLELAINSLRDALNSNRIYVEVDPPRVEKFDLAHFHGLWQPRFLRLAQNCRQTARPYVISPHGMLEPWAWRHRWWKKWPYFLLAERHFLNGASSLLSTSEIETGHLQRFHFRTPLATIPLGLPGSFHERYFEARSELGWSPNEFILLYLSRIHPKKGLHLLLSALVALVLDRSRYRLIIVGDGPKEYLNSLHDFASRHREELPKIDWLGPIWGDPKWKYLQGADLFCLPTQSENFGLAILEACQVGTPVLTTSETPWKEVLGAHGFPVAAPRVKSVRDKLNEFLRGGPIPLAHRQHLANQTHAEYDWDNLWPRYLAFYARVGGNAP
jgi:glycosyltransferase involved in cell wall biosynthesis